MNSLRLAAIITLASVCSGQQPDFNRDIRPILSNHCFQCHGPDDDARQAELRLDERDSAIKVIDGGAAIRPGDAAASHVFQRVSSAAPDTKMPPEDFGKPLNTQQIDLLKRWIDAGAEYAGHWSFQPIRRAAVPQSDLPARTPIDAFINQRLQQESIKPSAAAERATLIRRAYLDLLGLPPTVAQVDAFVHDDGPNAWSRLLDEILQNPHYGERWGRHWLDQARYADSHGYTNDNERTMWPWRDWVIRAFNEDLPFDQFTVQQLAGDLLKGATLEQQVATGFHRNTLINSEGGTKADQFRDEQVKDRVDTTGLVWMALTVGCAKCHTHKFDPITQHEYYRLYAWFNSTADANSETPRIKVPSPTQTTRISELEATQHKLQSQLKNDPQRNERQQQWEQAILAAAAKAADGKENPDEGWTVLELSGRSLHGSELRSQADKSLLVKGKPGSIDEYHATTRSPLTKVRSVRLDVLTDESLPQNGPGRAGNGNFVLSEFWFRTGDGRELRFNVAAAEHSQPGYEVAKSIDGKDDTGWAINGAPEGSLNRNRTAWFVLPVPLEVELNHALTFKLQFHQKDYGIGRFRLSISEDEWQDNPDVSALATLVNVPADKRSDEQKKKLEAAFLKQDSVLAPVQKELELAKKELQGIRQAIPTSMILQELDKPRTTHVQIRGDFLRTADEVSPGVPAVLPVVHKSTEHGNRLDFARWLIEPEHPLTSRVRVNRIWMRLFGRGLVETENDFGIQGTLPTHPDLLDWLSTEFQRLGWSQKKLIKLIMMSEVYRRSSAARPDLESIDALNLLLARQNRLRVEAEIVRDIALTVSGQLSPKIGGPGVFPPQEAGVYAFTQRRKNWKTSTGADRFRRGMYTWFYRSAPYPMLETFDVPKFNATCTRRDRSNTPLQSLTVANSQAMYELAQAFGDTLASADGSERERLKLGFRKCFSRVPNQRELDALEGYLKTSQQRFQETEQAWTAVARLLMNLDEFITRE